MCGRIETFCMKLSSLVDIKRVGPDIRVSSGGRENEKGQLIVARECGLARGISDGPAIPGMFRPSELEDAIGALPRTRHARR